MSSGFDVSITAIADDFYGAYLRCLEGKNERVDEYHRICADIVSVPAIVNGTFALELYLKSMLSHRRRSRKKTHSISELFLLLKQKQQSKIRECVEPKLPPHLLFDESLRGISDAFEYWRYIYEKEDLGFGLNDTLNVLPLFLDAVRSFSASSSGA
ncbi:MAG: HEPN domain-containing protein [Bacilli bacterium]|nr:HEPN domain-containing protein [Bacilli bacterium]